MNLCDNYSSENCARMDDNGPNNECYCEAKIKAYTVAVQAILSVSIQWEDQEAAWDLVYSHMSLLRDEFRKDTLSTFQQATVLAQKKMEAGIYPLEGVKAEKVWQKRRRGTDEWSDVKENYTYAVVKPDPATYRSVLRLIPQPNSEPLPGFRIGKQIANKIINISGDFEGTEVSEPTCGQCGKELTLVRPGKHQCDNRDCVQNKGVDEKKEPETLTWEQALKYMKSGGKVRHSYFSDNEWVTFDNGKLLFEDGVGCTVAFFLADRQSEVWKYNWFRVGGVSEEEPTTATCDEIEECLLNDGETALGIKSPAQAYLIARRLKHYFHIQKLKP